MSVHLLGIRHHGPGSAKNVKEYLERLKPDIVLVEGPPDAENLLQWVGAEDLKPPVALLIYRPEELSTSVFYPFATFSPEWQAILYARQNNIHVRFMDLPVMHEFALNSRTSQTAGVVTQQVHDAASKDTQPGDSDTETFDPIQYLADLAGFENGEKWWEHFVEYRSDTHELFPAIEEAMTELRAALPVKTSPYEQLREAWMRKTIRQAESELFTEIAVVCGAWHVPALRNMPKPKDDNNLLKGLPKVKVECTWIPWSYSRLSYVSGYGAGIGSPGWYGHLWNNPADTGTIWMTRVARIFRNHGMEISVAHVIEATKLAHALAALRYLPRPGLSEFNEATLSVMCGGEQILMQLVSNELIVSNNIGEVPENIPRPPLQADIEKTMKRLRIAAAPDHKDYTLDLRSDTDLERSIFFHRLKILGIGLATQVAIKGKGTFKELWQALWDPSLSIAIIEKGAWGNTVGEAATKYLSEKTAATSSLKDAGEALNAAIPADIPAAIENIIGVINKLAASTADVQALMAAVPALVTTARYGNVRKTDTSMMLAIVKGIITRVCVSLPAACTSVADDAAQTLLGLMLHMNDAVQLLQNEEATTEWLNAVAAISVASVSAPVAAGYATRLLCDCKLLTGSDLVRRFAYAMSPGNHHQAVAAWLEGFLQGSGMLLLFDNQLWDLLENWVKRLAGEAFLASLPILRRTFANFSAHERKKMGDKARMSDAQQNVPATQLHLLNTEQGRRGLQVVLQLLGKA